MKAPSLVISGWMKLEGMCWMFRGLKLKPIEAVPFSFCAVFVHVAPFVAGRRDRRARSQCLSFASEISLVDDPHQFLNWIPMTSRLQVRQDCLSVLWIVSRTCDFVIFPLLLPLVVIRTFSFVKYYREREEFGGFLPRANQFTLFHSCSVSCVCRFQPCRRPNSHIVDEGQPTARHHRSSLGSSKDDRKR